KSFHFEFPGQYCFWVDVWINNSTVHVASSDIQTLRYQKEKIVELDETVNRFGLEVVEGGHLDHGFSMYKTTFQLTDGNKYQTIVDVTVAYEFDIEVEECDMPSMTMAYTLNFVKSLEKYLLCDVAGDLVIG
ncbi:Phytohormone-binding protein CSBP, partial [Linum perenne]